MARQGVRCGAGRADRGYISVVSRPGLLDNKTGKYKKPQKKEHALGKTFVRAMQLKKGDSKFAAKK